MWPVNFRTVLKLLLRSTILLTGLLLYSTASAQSLFGTKWKLTEVNGAPVNSTRAFIEFDDSTKRASGDGSCNRFAGNFLIDGSKIKFSQIISTKRACLDQTIQQIENTFLANLERVTEFRIQRNTLWLNSANRRLLGFRADSDPTPERSPEAHVTGTVTYRQRIALPRGAVVKVRLHDVTGFARVARIAEEVIHPAGRQVPIAFDLTYDPRRISQIGRYVIQARIEHRGRLLFINTDWYPVITHGHPNTVNVVVKPARR